MRNSRFVDSPDVMQVLRELVDTVLLPLHHEFSGIQKRMEAPRENVFGAQWSEVVARVQRFARERGIEYETSLGGYYTALLIGEYRIIVWRMPKLDEFINGLPKKDNLYEFLTRGLPSQYQASLLDHSCNPTEEAIGNPGRKPEAGNKKESDENRPQTILVLVESTSLSLSRIVAGDLSADKFGQISYNPTMLYDPAEAAPMPMTKSHAARFDEGKKPEADLKVHDQREAGNDGKQA